MARIVAHSYAGNTSKSADPTSSAHFHCSLVQEFIVKHILVASLIGGFVGAVTVSLFGAGRTIAPDTIDLKDEEGKVRIRLAAAPEPHIVMYDKDGKQVITLHGKPDDAVITMASSKDKRTVGLRLKDRVANALVVTDTKGRIRLEAGGDDEQFGLRMFDDVGNISFNASSWSQPREPELTLSWKNGEKLWFAPLVLVPKAPAKPAK